MEWLTEDTWIIADTHFYHKNIIEYANRPLNHNDLIIQNWNQMVNPEDTILHLGDVILAKPNKIRQITPLLHGNKYLVNGNHDSRKKLRRMMGFTTFERNQMLFKKFGKYLLIFSHVPVYKIKHPFTYNLHGHIHQLKSKTDNHINMCVEVRHYRPWKLGDILEEIKEKNNE